MLCHTRTQFKLLFAIILFSQTGEAHNAQISEFQLYYTRLLEKHLSIDAIETRDLTSVRLGTVTEFIAGISE